MKSLVLPAALVVIGALIYQTSQKSVPKLLNPLLVLIVAYGFGILLCLIFLFLSSNHQPITQFFKGLNWTVFGVGFGTAMIEMGYLLAYRTGSNITHTYLVASISIALLLIPIGIVFYKEHITMSNLFGVMLCVVGIGFIAIK